MRKIYFLLCLQCYCFILFAQEATISEQTKPKKSIFLSANVSMPIWAIAFKGFGAEFQADYKPGKVVNICGAAGFTNYANMGITGMKNYNSYGQHIKLGLSLNKYLEGKNSARIAYQFMGYWANANETGIWNTDAANVKFWQDGYYFDVWRQVWGLELSVVWGWKIHNRHSIFIKNFLNIMGYEKHYFPLASVSGAGYLLSAGNEGGFATGMQVWYSYQLR
jgi:hypothetical protein